MMQDIVVNMTEEDIQAVWNKGEQAIKAHPAKWRKDAYGAWICRDHYGDQSSTYGWEIDQIVPVTEGGTGDLSNLRPLHWKNAAAKRDGKSRCPVTAHGGQNLDFS